MRHNDETAKDFEDVHDSGVNADSDSGRINDSDAFKDVTDSDDKHATPN